MALVRSMIQGPLFGSTPSMASSSMTSRLVVNKISSLRDRRRGVSTNAVRQISTPIPAKTGGVSKRLLGTSSASIAKIGPIKTIASTTNDWQRLFRDASARNVATVSQPEIHTAPERPAAVKIAPVDTASSHNAPVIEDKLQDESLLREPQKSTPWADRPKIKFWHFIIFTCLCSSHPFLAFLFAGLVYEPVTLYRYLGIAFAFLAFIAYQILRPKGNFSKNSSKNEGEKVPQAAKKVPVQVAQSELSLR